MKRKYVMAIGIMVFMLAVAIGCSTRQEVARTNTTLSVENKTDKGTEQPSQSVKDESDTPEGNNSKSDNSEIISFENANPNSEMMYIGGKVRSIEQDSFVISRTLMEEDSSIVIMPDEGSPEEELVTIQCTDSTVFEHWTIQGGRVGIVKENASFSDIQKGSGMEAEGYFEEEEFVAEKVIIEEYM